MSQRKAATGAQRVAAYRARKSMAGGRRVDAEITPAAARSLEGHMARGMTAGQVLSELLEANPPPQ